jgi:hypothetical protein
VAASAEPVVLNAPKKTTQALQRQKEAAHPKIADDRQQKDDGNLGYPLL